MGSTLRQDSPAASKTRGDVAFHDGVTLIRLLQGKADFSTVLSRNERQRGTR